MKKILYLTLCTAIMLVVLSCEFGPLGIFRSFEIESQLDDRELNNDLSVGSITKINGTYYIGAGKVYSRTPTTTWESLTPPAEDVLCIDLVSFQSTLFAVFYKKDGTESTLYYLGGDNTFQPVPELQGKKIVTIISAEKSDGTTTLLSTVQEGDYGYSLYYKSSAAEPFQQSIVSDSSSNLFIRKIPDGTYFNDSLWIICSSNLYLSNDDGKTFSVVTDGPSITNSEDALYPLKEFSRIYSAPTLKTLFVSTEDGFVYGFNGTAWSDGSNELTDSSIFYDMSELPVGNENNPNRTLLVVGSSSGYYEAVFNTIPPTIDDLNAINFSLPGLDSYSTSENYLNTVLSESVVLSFYLDRDVESGPHLFACTLIQGLWRNEVETERRVWNRE